MVAVGKTVSHLHEGDRVAWCSILGTYAEYAVAPAERVVSIPIGLSFEQAAAALLQGITAHYLSHSACPIQPGDEVLIHAGAGGTGLLMTQLAKRRGARVLTTVSNEEKAELSYQAGADDVILCARSDFGDEVKRLTEGRGLAAAYDSIGKSTVDLPESPRNSRTVWIRERRCSTAGSNEARVSRFVVRHASDLEGLHAHAQ